MAILLLLLSLQQQLFPEYEGGGGELGVQPQCGHRQRLKHHKGFPRLLHPFCRHQSIRHPSHNNRLGHTKSIIIINVNSHRLASQQRIVLNALYQQPLEGGDTKAQWR